MKHLNLRLASCLLGCTLLFACGGGPAPDEGQKTAQAQEDSPVKTPIEKAPDLSPELRQLTEWVELIVEDAELSDRRLRDDLEIDGEIEDQKDVTVEYDLMIHKNGELDGTIGDLVVEDNLVSNQDGEVFARINVVKGMRSIDLRVVDSTQD